MKYTKTCAVCVCCVCVCVCRGEVLNGGFGLVLDGTDDAERRAKLMLSWDVNNGVRYLLSLQFICS